MQVSPAATVPAGPFVLPENVERWDDLVSVTKPAEGLLADGPFANDAQYLPLIYLTKSGSISALWDLNDNLKSVSRFYLHYAQKLHVIRPLPNSDRDWFDGEVWPTIHDNPWMKHQWYRDNFLRWVELLPRPSEKHKGLVSYFQTPEKRARDIRTPIKPGRFLKKFFGDLLSEEQIHELALEWSNYTDLQSVKITQDADEIEEIYRNGPSSCMAHSFWGKTHPSRVYAGPDLAVAYLGSPDKASARTVVWPAKKIWVCLYGDESRLKAGLTALGYSEGTDSQFAGARIQRIEHHERFILPYIDCSDYVDDNGSYLILGGDEVACHSTDGVSEPRYTCDECSSTMSEDNGTYISGEGIDVCDHCLSSHFTYCDGNSEYYRDDEIGEIAGICYESYSKGFLDQSPNWFFCEETELYYSVDDASPVQLYEDSRTIASTVAEERGFFCEHKGVWSLETEHQVKLKNGKSVHMQSFSSEQQLNEWLTANQTEVGEPDAALPSPDQLSLPIQEAA